MVLSKDALWESGHDETVEVNQRALIDKVLARYSGEFTVFRELLQNSDDAQSKAVEIRFETQNYLDRKTRGEGVEGEVAGALPDLKTTPVHQWTFKNNGIVFRDEDWTRLKKIAEGNPDEEKIGAFGVGFYSLFSVTEEPFVSSGNQWMGFYWKDKKDQLFARRGQLPAAAADDESRRWTSFTMSLRDPNPIPTAFDFTRFLASSITFMRHLSEVTVYFDDKRLVKLNKASGLPKELSIPKGFKNRSPSGAMTVTNVESTPIYIQAEVMKWIYTSGTEKKARPVSKPDLKPATGGGFFSSLFSALSTPATTARIPTPSVAVEVTNPLEINQTSVSLSIFSAAIQVHLDKKITSELVRSTKKNPPSKMKFELIYTSKDEYDASIKEDVQLGTATGSIFQGLRADLNKTGDAKVFIGHSTSQSTGIGGHIAARFIPTVERESIDFMDRYVAIWNKELLYVGGFLSRAAYQYELDTVQQLWKAASTGTSPPNDEIKSQLFGRVLHALQFFDFHDSQPSRQVSSDMRDAFFGSSSNASFPMISSNGVRSSKDIRLPNPVLATFVKEVPMLPDDILAGATTVIGYLKFHGMIKDIEFPDILRELQARPLTLDECVACLKWWITESSQDQATNRENYMSIRSQLLNAVVVATQSADGGEQKIIPLNTIRCFFNPKSSTTGSIPLDSPLPDYLLPIAIGKQFKPESLSSCFPWVEFGLLHWLSYICGGEKGNIPAQYDLSLSPIWAEKVIGVVARGWNHLSEDMKAKIKLLLQDKPCIPTTNGMKVPGDAYFPNVNIFPDLPVVTFPSNLPIKGNVERFLQYLDVRKHVELQLIFNRMIKTNEWTVNDLVKYLISIRDLNEDEIQRLQKTSAFPKEMKQGETYTKRPRFMAHQLYPPVDVFRTLGLPILDWGDQTKWRDRSDEAKFLHKIGLQRFPPLKQLIELCAGEDPKIRAAAFQYLIDHMETQYPRYDPMEFKDQRFIPALKNSDPCLASITEVYSHAEWSSMGFSVLQPAYQPQAVKLKIREHPSAGPLVSLLQTTRLKDDAQAKTWFRLLSSRVNDFRSSDLQQLAATPFVPIIEKGGVVTRWLPPSQCYLRGDTKESFHSALFTFVDFGSSGNAFLTACGARNQPSVEEVAKELINNPQHFYDLSGGPISFLGELRNLAVNARSLSSVTLTRMKRSPILLGMKRKSRNQNKGSDDWDEEEYEIIYELKKPSQIVIADDTNTYQAFGNTLFAAPQEDILEAFYVTLGSPRLSRIVREEYRTSGELLNSKVGLETRTLILERLPLFLHEHTHTATRVSFSWLSSGNNFIVRTFGKLAVVKQLDLRNLQESSGNNIETRKQDASAVSRRQGSGPIELWIAGNAQIDMYEVATSLNRVLFDSPKTNDALLFMTILSTDLRSLKRRGYNVERILRQQKEARLQVAAAAEAEKAQKAKEMAKQQAQTPHPMDSDTASLASTATLSAAQNLLTNLKDQGKPSSSTFAHSLQSLKQRFKPSPQQPQNTFSANQEKAIEGPPPPPPVPHASKPLPEQPPQSDGFSMNNQYLSSAKQSQKPQPSIMDEPVPEIDGMPGGFTPGARKPGTGTGVTPLSSISRNVDLAIDSCKPESGNLLRNREQMQRVKETLDDGYCDISGRKENLHNIAEMGNVKIYLSDEIPLAEAESFMQSKRESIARFIHIMRPLANIYRLPLESLHIFYDLEGGLIAFNRDGSLFLNLRHYEQWHDASVSKGDLRNAYVSWYFTLAHEIAHNLVHPHNSEHEFYFSAICEQFMLDFTRLLGGTS